jgi:cytochrome c biogenesis protein CcdA
MEQKTDARRARAIKALVEAPTVEAAARSSGIGRTTLYRYMSEDDFKEELGEARAEAFAAGLAALKSAAAKAASTLAALMDSRSENTRRLAAIAVLSLGLKAAEAVDFESRLVRLEQFGRPKLRFGL